MTEPARDPITPHPQSDVVARLERIEASLARLHRIIDAALEVLPQMMRMRIKRRMHE